MSQSKTPFEQLCVLFDYLENVEKDYKISSFSMSTSVNNTLNCFIKTDSQNISTESVITVNKLGELKDKRLKTVVLPVKPE